MVLTQQRATLRDPKKFPAVQLFILALVRVAEPVALTSIFPYAWKLVLHFEVCDKSNASFYAGLLISAFAFAESITGMYWGGVSDRIGRKPVLLMGCVGTVLSLLVVGFSWNFWIALIGRFLGGALNGNIGVIQTMVGELTVNPKHEPKAYAVMPFVWSIGTIVGPSIGGYFANPSKSFPSAFEEHGIFSTFPYLLPNVICAALMSVSIIAGYFFLEETHPDMQPWSTPEDLENTVAETPLMATQATTTTPAADLMHESYGTFIEVSEENHPQQAWTVKSNGRQVSIDSAPETKVFTTRVIMLTVALGIFTYHSMTYDHLLPIFFQDERVTGAEQSIFTNENGSLAGGLGLSTQDVGVIMSFNGIIALFIQAVIFPIMASWLGIWKLFVLVTILHPIAYFIMPYLAMLPEHQLYPGIYACLTIRNVLSILAYPVLLILLKEASPNQNSLGKINGLAASTGAGCRTIASPIAGLLYGIGIRIDFVALAWWASALVAIAGALQVLFISQKTTGVHHHIRPMASCSFLPRQQEQEEHKREGVRSEVHEREDSEDETTPLRITEWR